MCARQKADPKLLPKLPLFSQNGEIMTNGASSPCHMTSDGEQNEAGVPMTKLELDIAVMFQVEQAIVLSTLDSRHLCLDLVKESEIELERIDQQLLELGPYAQDAYDDADVQPESAPVLISPPPDVRRGKKGKQVVPNKSNRKGSRGQEDYLEPLRGGWRAVGGSGGWGEVERRPEDKELPKKKWRKVGSAGPIMRGKEGQLDAQSDPLNVSSASVVISSDVEMRGLGQPPQGGRERAGDDEGVSHPSPTRVVQSVDHQARSGNGHPTKPPSGSVSTTAHTTPSCNTSSPSDLPGHERTQPTAHWKPTFGVATPTTHQDHLQGKHAHPQLNFNPRPQPDTEEVDVMRVEEEDTTRARLTASALDVEGQSSDSHDRHLSLKAKSVHRSDSPLPQQTKSSSSPKTTTTPHHGHRHTEVPHHLQQPPTGVPGFSISHLAKGSDLPPQLSATDPHAAYMEHARSSLNSVPSPLSEMEGNMRKRRTSSSSSHRSTRQPSLDDNHLTRSASPLSTTSHSRGPFAPGIIWDGTNAIPANTCKDKPQAMDSKMLGIPLSMWPPGMALPTDATQVQPFPLSSPFLAVSNPWLRGGMIAGLPFRPALYPTGATANSLDPTNPYKSMLGLPLYPFAPSGLKGPFPTPAFSTPSSVLNSQPQTPSSISTATPGFSFGQFPLPPGLSAGALREAQSRLAAAGGAATSLEQLSSLPAAVGGDAGKQRRSPDTNTDAPQPWPMLPGMPMLQTPFGFGVPNPLSSSVSQASQLSLLAQRGPVPLSTSPLTLATQSVVPGGPTSDGQQMSSVEPFHHQTAGGVRRGKKQSGSAIDLTGREMRLIEAPSPQEAVKMATQRSSPFQDPSRFSPKLKSIPDSVSAPASSSPLIPTFVTNPNALASQAHGSILSYPLLSTPSGANSPIPGHMNPSQLMGVALPGSHMIPMNYPATIPSVNGKVEEGVGKKKRSPKRGSGTQKLRIHQMDFKQQGKVDRRRKRPWKPQESQQEESNGVKPAVILPAKVAIEQQQSSVAPEDNYALNMLADCSSKEKVTHAPSASAPKKELPAKRDSMRSPGSIAGANSLLLLSEPSPVASSTGNEQRDISSENAVVAGLLRLSNSPVPSSTPIQVQQSVQNASTSVSESGTRSVAAEAILMMGQMGNGGEEDAKRLKEAPLSDTRGPASENREKDEVDSEKTDTDSEATLSPTTPAPTTTTRSTRAAKSNTAHSPPQISNGVTSSLPSAAEHLARTVEKVPASSYDATGQKHRVSSTSPHAAEQSKVATEIPALGAVMEKVSSGPALLSGEHIPMDAREERKLLALDSTSTRLEMVAEEEDTDVDIENVDSSLLDEPDEPAEPAKPVSSLPGSPVLRVASPVGIRSSMIPPEMVPTSPPPPQESTSPPASLQTVSPHGEPGSGEPRSGEPGSGEQRRGDVGVVEAEDEMQLDKTSKPNSGFTEATAEVDPPIDVLSPPKRPRLEETRDEVRKEEEEEIKNDDSTLETVEADTTHPEMVTRDREEAAPAPSSDAVAPHSLSLPPVSDQRDPEETMETSATDELKLKPASDSSNGSTRPGGGFGSPIVESHLLTDSTGREELLIVVEKSSDEDNQETESEGKSNLSSATAPKATVTETEENTSLERDNDEVSGTTSKNSSIFLPEELLATTEEEKSFPGDPPPLTGSPATADHNGGCKPITPPTPHSPHPPPPHSPHPHPPHSPRPSTPPSGCVSPPVEGAGEEDAAAVGEGTREPKDASQSQEGGTPVAADNGAHANNVTPVDKTTKKVDSTADAQSGVSPTVSPSVAQNRLPVGKSGFDRHHQGRKLLSAQHTHKPHPRDDKNSQSKKWSRMGDPGVRGRGLFDVDPQDGSRRQKTETRPSDRDTFKHASSSEGRKVKPRIVGVPGGHGLSNKATSSRPPRDDPPHRHSRPQEGNQGGPWEQRESSSKQKTRPSGRQGSRLSPSSSSEHGSTDHLRDRDELPTVANDDQQQGRAGGGERGRSAGGHQNSHGWREDRVSPTEHSRERGYASKHKAHHRTESKQSFEHGRKISRLEKDLGQHVSHRKRASSMETNNDERGVAVLRRYREEDPESVSLMRVKHGASRKRSYESVSEDELLEETNRHSSRESSLVVEDRIRGDHRSSQELTAAEQRGSSWRKEPKRTPESPDDVDDFLRISKPHKKHKHDGKEHKERRKWRKNADGSDSKQKWSSEDKPWLSYHKH